MLRRACLALPQTETTPIGPLTLRSTLRACGGISNFPVSVEYLTSSRGEPGCAAGAEKLLVSTGLAFLPPHMNDIVKPSFSSMPAFIQSFCVDLATLCPGSKAHNTTQDLNARAMQVCEAGDFGCAPCHFLVFVWLPEPQTWEALKSSGLALCMLLSHLPLIDPKALHRQAPFHQRGVCGEIC